jgi:hypothetical protein
MAKHVAATNSPITLDIGTSLALLLNMARAFFS